MRTAFVVIATGDRYHRFVDRLLRSMQVHLKFEYTVFLWTDIYYPVRGVVQFRLENAGFPRTTLHRYHTFLTQQVALAKFDQIFYCDVDMEFVADVRESDICSDGITATLHPGFIHDRRHLECPGTDGTPERRPVSTACIPEGSGNKYFCGGFNGGTSAAYLRMAQTIKQNVDLDKASGLTALWHDESHLNRYLHDNPPARILTPSFCFPEDYNGKWLWIEQEYPPVLVALDKAKNR